MTRTKPHAPAAVSGSAHRGFLLWTALGLGAAALFWLLPPFHVVPLRAARQESADAAFNAAAFVEKLWNERLLKSADRAINAATLLAEIKRDPQTARVKYGRTVGLSSTRYYFVSGVGRVIAWDNNSVSLALDEKSSSPDVILETGNIFGNAVRDATGLLNVNDFPNSRDFNDISSEINQRIEERVLPALRTNRAVGKTVKFVGCAEIAGDETDLRPLRLVPLVAEVH